MKNRILLFFFSILFSSVSMAQITIRIGSHEGISWKPSTVPTSGFTNAAEGRSYAQEIIDVLGLKANFEVREANVPNAAAVTYGGKRYVLYNPKFITQLENSTGTRWAGISVLAHEIGHHLNGHTLTASGSQPALELEADEFSGFVLRKMGASLADAQAAMKVLASINASKTHPGKNDRLASIATGWQKANEQMGGSDVARTKPVTRQQQAAVSRPQTTTRPQNTSAAAIDSRYILGQVRFNADPYSSYYVTTGYNLVKVKNSQLAVIGKLSALNNRRYPYMISDQSTQLLVDAYGNILTRQGRQVGKLSAKG